MSFKKQAVNYLQNILEKKGPLPYRLLAGHLGGTTEGIREAAGTNPEGLLAFVKECPYFVVRKGDIIALPQGPPNATQKHKPKIQVTKPKVIAAPSCIDAAGLKDFFVQILVKNGKISLDRLMVLLKSAPQNVKTTTKNDKAYVKNFLLTRANIFFISDDGKEIDLVLRKFLSYLPVPTEHTPFTLILAIALVSLEARCDKTCIQIIDGKLTIHSKYIFTKLSTYNGTDAKVFESKAAFENVFVPLSGLFYFNLHPNKRYSFNFQYLSKDHLQYLFINSMLDWEDYISQRVIRQRLSCYRLTEGNTFIPGGTAQFTNILNKHGYVGRSSCESWTTADMLLSALEEEVVAPVDQLPTNSLHGKETTMTSFLKTHPKLFGFNSNGGVYSKPKLEKMLCDHLKPVLLLRGYVRINDVLSSFSDRNLKRIIHGICLENILALLKNSDSLAFILDVEQNIILKLVSHLTFAEAVQPKVSIKTITCSSSESSSTNQNSKMKVTSATSTFPLGMKDDREGSIGERSGLNMKNFKELEKLTISFLINSIGNHDVMALQALYWDLLSAPCNIQAFVGLVGLEHFLGWHPKTFCFVDKASIFLRTKAVDELCSFFVEKCKKKEGIIKCSDLHSYFTNCPPIIKNLVLLDGIDGIIDILKKKKHLFQCVYESLISSDLNDEDILIGFSQVSSVNKTEGVVTAEVQNPSQEHLGKVNENYAQSGKSITKTSVDFSPVHNDDQNLSESSKLSIGSRTSSAEVNTDETDHDMTVTTPSSEMENLSLAFLMSIFTDKDCVSIHQLLGELISAPMAIREYLGKIGLMKFIQHHPKDLSIFDGKNVFPRKRAEDEMIFFFSERLRLETVINLDEMSKHHCPILVKDFMKLLGHDGIVEILKRENSFSFVYQKADEQVDGAQSKIIGVSAIHQEEWLQGNRSALSLCREKGPKTDSEDISQELNSDDISQEFNTDHTDHCEFTGNDLQETNEKHTTVLSCEGRVHSVFKSWGLISHEGRDFLSLFSSDVCEFIPEGKDLSDYVHIGQNLVYDLKFDECSLALGGDIVNVKYKPLFLRCATENNLKNYALGEHCAMEEGTFLETDMMRSHVRMLMHLSVILLSQGSLPIEALFKQFLKVNQDQEFHWIQCESDVRAFLDLYKDLFQFEDGLFQLGSQFKKGYVSTAFQHHGIIEPINPDRKAFFGLADIDNSILKVGTKVDYIDLPFSSFPLASNSSSPFSRAILILINNEDQDEERPVEISTSGERNDLVSTGARKSDNLENIHSETEIEMLQRSTPSVASKAYSVDDVRNDQEAPAIPQLCSQRLLNPTKETTKDMLSPSTSMASTDGNLDEIADLFLLTRIVTKLIKDKSVSRNKFAKSPGLSGELRAILRNIKNCNAFVSLHPLLIGLSEDCSTFQLVGLENAPNEWKILDAKILMTRKNIAYAQTGDGEVFSIIRKTFYTGGNQENGRKSRDLPKGGIGTRLKVGDNISCISVPLQSEFVVEDVPNMNIVLKRRAILTWDSRYNLDLMSYSFKHADDDDEYGADSEALICNAEKLINPGFASLSSSSCESVSNSLDASQLAIDEKPKAGIDRQKHSLPPGLLRNIQSEESLFDLLGHVALLLVQNEEISIGTMLVQLENFAPECRSFLGSEDDLETFLSIHEAFLVRGGSVRLSSSPSSGCISKLKSEPSGDSGHIRGDNFAYFTESAVHIPQEPNRECHLDYKLKVKSLVKYICVNRWLLSPPPVPIGKKTPLLRAVLVYLKEGPNISYRQEQSARQRKGKLSSSTSQTPIQRCRSPNRLFDFARRSSLDDLDTYEVGSQTISTGAIVMTKYV